jgi:integrase
LKTPPGIKKLPNGKFQARYFAGFDAAGKRIYPSQRFDRQSEAIDWMAKEKAKKNNNVTKVITNGKLTVGEFVDQFLVMVAPTIRQITLKDWTWKLTKHVKETDLGTIKLKDLRPGQIEYWQAQRLNILAPSTTRTVRSIFATMLRKARILNLLSSNPIELVCAPKTRKTDYHVLTLDQARAFLGRCETFDQDRQFKEPAFGLIFQLALKTGLRPEEYLGLKWEDLELRSDGGAVKVQRVVHLRPGGGFTWEQPKTEKGKRKVNFDDDLSRRLQEHRRRQLEHRLQIGPSWKNLDLVFGTCLGGPITQRTLRKYFYQFMSGSGIPRMRVYDLRHSFVTLSLVAGVDVKTISYEAGHASVGFTLDTYGHVLEEMKQTSGAKRGALFAGNG